MCKEFGIFLIQGLPRLAQIVLFLLQSEFFISTLLRFVTYTFQKKFLDCYFKSTRLSSVIVHNNLGAVILEIISTRRSSFEPPYPCV